MPDLIYLSMARFPTEKAHGLQIAQNCEAFANIGYDVCLWASGRKNTPNMQQITDPFAHYGVSQAFRVERIPCIDLYWLAGGRIFLEKVAFVIVISTYMLMALLRIMFTPKATLYYSRDEYALFILSLILPPEKLAFEIHQFWASARTAWIQRRVVQRVGHIIAITPRLAEDVIQQHGAKAEHVLIAHDGIRAERFRRQWSILEAREKTGWPQDAFIVGYMGRLHTMGMDKGVGLLVDVLSRVEGASLALVGGPDELAEALRQRWLDHGGSTEEFIYGGQAKPDEIPMYLSAFDVCAMPFPWNDHYAYYMSPLKLFEYMASERAILASDLPSIRDVIQHEETAMIFEAENKEALANAIGRLRDDPSLRERLGIAAREAVFREYTWAARAQHIREHIERSAP